MFQRMIFLTFAALLLATCLHGQGTQPGSPQEISSQPVVLVICPEPLWPGLTAWVDYRTRQGEQIVVMPPPGDPASLRALIRDQAAESGIRALVLLGRPGSERASCPVDSVEARVINRFGSPPDIATDNPFADLDGDGLPEFPVGRIPATSPDELRQVLARSMAYETEASWAGWRRRINLVAGVGGFDPWIDSLLDKTSEWIIRQVIPEEYAVSMTWANWSSPYCPDPRRFSDTAIARFNEGCFFWVYVGHGHVETLDRVRTPAGWFPILNNQTTPRLSSVDGSPIALMLCCYCGAFDAPQACLSETMLKQAAGPVAVISSTRVTMPYGEARLSLGMMEDLFHGDCGTLGELLHRAKRKLLDPDPDSGSPDPATGETLRNCREMIDALARANSPNAGELDVELRETVAMFHLLGDPLLRIPRPLEVAATVDDSPRAGQVVAVSGTAPVDGTLTVEICYVRGRFWNRPARRKDTDLAEDRGEFLQSDYERTRDMICTAHREQVTRGPFRIELPLPDRARGEAVVRTYLEGSTRHAMGSTAIDILPALKPAGQQEARPGRRP